MQTVDLSTIEQRIGQLRRPAARGGKGEGTPRFLAGTIVRYLRFPPSAALPAFPDPIP